jgi:iron complex outermembrane receptor protein
MMLRWLTFVFALIWSAAPAEPVQTITGIALDADSHQPVAGASIRLNGHSTVSDSAGLFEFADVEPGRHQLRLTHVGYRPWTGNHQVTTSSDTLVAYLIPRPVELSPVVVTEGRSRPGLSTMDRLSPTVRGEKLHRNLGQTLAATLKSEAGLAVRSMGPAPARPVIRGLGGSRVQINEDGIATTDLSSTSPDHAVTVEPFSVERLEVVRGPRALLYTATTGGGVVNAVRHSIPETRHSKITGTAGVVGESANRGRLGSIIVEAPVHALMLRGEVNTRKTSQLDTPIGRLNNSSAHTSDLSGAVSYPFEHGYVGLSYRSFDLEYGIPGGFIGGHPSGVDIDMRRRQYDLRGRFDLSGKGNDVKFAFTRAYYRHREWEAGDLLGAEFRLVNYLGRVDWHHGSWLGCDGGTIGLWFKSRDYDIGGHVFNPPTRSTSLAAYWWEALSLGPVGVEAAVRLGHTRIDPEYDDPKANIGPIRERRFTVWSGAVSALFEMNPWHHLALTLSRSARVPTIEELFSEGPHLAAYSFEVGNPALDVETGYHTELTVAHDYSSFDLILTGFYSHFDGFIIPRQTGEINYATFLPVYASQGVDAAMWGVEGQTEVRLGSVWKVGATGTYTRGFFRDGAAPLPAIPPFKGTFELSYEPGDLRTGMVLRWADSQKRLDQFEEPTDGYAVLDAQVQYSLGGDGLLHTFALNVENIFDTEYRNHLSRIKSIMPEAGRGVRLTYKLFFQI